MHVQYTGPSRSLYIGRFKAPYRFPMAIVSPVAVPTKHSVASLSHFKVNHTFLHQWIAIIKT